MVAMARHERELAQPRRSAQRRAAEPIAQDPSDVEASELDDIETTEVRTVVVRRSPFATPEDMLRATIRNAEHRRPREVYPSRLLVRGGGMLASCGGEPADVDRRALVRSLRPQISQCILEELVRRDGLILPGPAALVLQQAAATESIDYSLTVHLAAGQPPTVSSRRGTLSAAGRECIANVVGTRARREGATSGDIRLSVFMQPGLYYGGTDLHRALALESAIMGWTHYERGEYREALEYFRDAYWVFELVEYQVLVGMALERLGHPQAAAKAYRRYVDRRPYAPRFDELRQRAARLAATD